MGSFSYDSTGISLERKYALIPDGWWPFKIIEAEAGESKKGYPMVTVKAKCLAPEHSNKGNVLHHVVFLPKGSDGAGMNVHFRKAIGVPWEGNVTVNTDEWEGKKFMAKVISEEYNGRTNNKFKEISPFGGPLGNGSGALKSDDQVPF